MNENEHIDSIEQQADNKPLSEVGATVESDDRLEKLERERGEVSTEGTVSEMLSNLE